MSFKFISQPNVTHEVGAVTALARPKSGAFVRSKGPTSRLIRRIFRRKKEKALGLARVSQYNACLIAWDGPWRSSTGKYRHKATVDLAFSE